MIVKEIQDTITKGNTVEVSEEEFLNIIRLIAPGTNIRIALNGALKTGKGAIVAVENNFLPNLIDGGFRINANFTPQKFVELSKMDGAIILSKDMKKITHANVMLAPDIKIKTVETGTRHKAAERTAKQIGTLVIAISERRNDITLYYKNIRFPILPTEELLRKVREFVQIIEKHKESFEKDLAKLTRSELRNQQSLSQALSAIQRGLLIQKTLSESQRYLIELGKEGSLLKLRIKEITEGVEDETDYVIRDYVNGETMSYKKAKSLFSLLNYEEIMDKEKIMHSLGYETYEKISQIKGWRILSKTSLSNSEIGALVTGIGSLGVAVHSNVSSYSNILGAEKAKIFSEEINRIKFDLQ